MLSVNNLSMRFGGKILFRDASFQLNPGIHYGLVGANGSGKSTLIKIITNELMPESGGVSYPNTLKIGSLKQSHFLYEGCLIRDVVMMGKQDLWQALQDKEKLLEKEHFSEKDCETLAALEKIIENHDGYEAESIAAKLLEGLGISEKFHLQSMNILSGGYKLRVLLAQVLFSSPEVLVLDEPTNHLDLFSIRWLENYLKQFAGTILLCSHDREFLNSVSQSIIDLDYESIKLYKGNYNAFIEAKASDQEQRELQLNNQMRKRQHLQQFVDRFGAKATKASQAQSRMRAIEKIDDEMSSLEVGQTSRKKPFLNFQICRQSGAVALTVKDISKAFREKQVLENISFSIERGERVAFVGANGIGKSTLLEIITRSIPHDSGSFTWGFEAHYAYFPQNHGREVNGNCHLLDWLGQFDSLVPQEKLRNILGKVLFTGDDVLKPVGVLSGGETARLILAKMMLIKHNVLIFDEPTNHLDIQAIEELIQSIENYSGTILLVSHNRHFISQIASRIIEITPEGIQDFKGNYSEYVAWRDHDILSRENSQKKEKQETANKLNYEEQKKLQRVKEQAERKRKQAEALCYQLEMQLATYKEKINSAHFLQMPYEQQKPLLDEKMMLEQKLEQAIENWESVSQATIFGS